jgi:hypothetical protein
MRDDYATRQDLLRSQQQNARLAQRIANQFRDLGIAGVSPVSETPNVVVDISVPYPTFSVTLKIILEVTQGTTGGWTLTPDSSVVFGTDLDAVDLSPMPGAVDVLGFMYIDSISKYRFVALSRGYQ